MSTLVSRLFRQSIRTFGRSRFVPVKKEKDSAFDSNVKSLEGLIHQMRCRDINLNLRTMDPKTWTTTTTSAADGKGPVSFYCMDVYLDKLLTMKVYILKPGMKLPLHDHPGMHGFIKVLDGRVKITSYSETQLKAAAGAAGASRTQPKPNPNAPPTPPKLLYATKLTETVFESKSRVSVLTPRKGNFHEIECMDQPAAFFDLLAPPYNNERRMNFYDVEPIDKSNVVKLNLVKKPVDLSFDELPYMGPSLT